MTQRLVLSALLVTCLIGPAPGLAQTASDKFVRGLAGMVAGVLEVPGNMVSESRKRGPEVGVPLGFVKGLGMIVVRELVGVYEFLTAPFPVPDGYRPLIQPEYPWSYFDDGRSSDLDVHTGPTTSTPAY